jgi:hypothetical protein
LEQRLAVAVAVEVEAVEAGPIAFEDHERAAVVPAPKLADFVAPLVDDAELVFFLGVRRNVEADFDVQILLRGRFRRCRCTVPGTAKLGYLVDVPWRDIRRGRQDLCRQNERRAEKQQRHTYE